jgi:hypothetical protein
LIHPILRSWLDENAAEAHALANASDILDLQQLNLNRFVADFSSCTLVRDPGGEPTETSGVRIGFFFDQDYLRKTDPQTLITVLKPTHMFHPNSIGPFMCIGAVAPGTPLTQLLYRAYEVFTYGNFTPNEKDSLNSEACCFARRNQSRFPLESRPLKRRQNKIGVIEMEAL